MPAMKAFVESSEGGTSFLMRYMKSRGCRRPAAYDRRRIAFRRADPQSSHGT